MPSRAKVIETVIAMCTEAPSPARGADTVVGGCTGSQVKKAMGTIHWPCLDGSETSSGGIRQRGDDDKAEVSCNAPTSPEVEIGE